MRKAICFALILSACASHQNEEREVAALQAQTSRDDQELAGVESDAAHLSAEWDDVRSAFEQSRVRFLAASSALSEARQRSDSASATFARATAEWQSAAEYWRLYGQLVVVAAEIDAVNIKSAGRSGLEDSARGEVECQPMSTATFRRHLIAEGRDLAGMDIDHIVPHAWGGADDPSNYRVISSHINRRMQDDWDHAKCAAVGERCAIAVAISRKCGSYRGLIP